METCDNPSLNRRFGLAGKLEFSAGPGGFCMATLKSAHSETKVTLHGAHVLHFQPQGEAPLLWMSRQSHFKPGKPIRGGIPICWPWFGPHPADSNLPQHGVARLMLWTVLETAEMPDGMLKLRLGFDSNEQTLAIWPHPFHLEMEINAGRQLSTSLSTENTGHNDLRLTMALHHYFNVQDVTTISITGLENIPYIDKLVEIKGCNSDPVRIQAETSRVYNQCTAGCTIRDPGLGRHIQIAKTGSQSTVVWNPWIKRSMEMPDFGDDEYMEMICVETANTLDDALTLAPGERHVMTAVISSETDS